MEVRRNSYRILGYCRLCLRPILRGQPRRGRIKSLWQHRNCSMPWLNAKEPVVRGDHPAWAIMDFVNQLFKMVNYLDKRIATLERASCKITPVRRRAR